jgi:hypothetical protein
LSAVLHTLLLNKKLIAWGQFGFQHSASALRRSQ